MVYETLADYVASSTTKIERLEKLNSIIDTLYDSALKSAEDANIQSYAFDSGQTRVESVYRSPTAIASAITIYTKQYKEIYYSVYGRRCTVLRPASHPKLGNI